MRTVGIGNFVSLHEGNAPGKFTRMHNDKLFADFKLVQEKTGIETRLIANPQETIVSLSKVTLARLLERAHMDVRELGGVVLATCYPGDPRAMADQLRDQSGIAGESFGVDRACAGFLAATEIAHDTALKINRPIAVVATEKLSDMVNWEEPGDFQNDREANDRLARGKASKIFGDGSAGALVYPPDRPAGFEILDVFSAPVPLQADKIVLEQVEQSQDPTGKKRDVITECLNMPNRAGAELKRDGTAIMIEALRSTIQRAVDSKNLFAFHYPEHFVPHQANGSMIKKIDQDIRLELERILGSDSKTTVQVWNRITHMGNVSAACLPSVMAAAQSVIQEGQLVGLSAVGAGSPHFNRTKLEMGGMLLRRR